MNSHDEDDIPDLTREFVGRMKPARENAKLMKAVRRGRPPMAEPKVAVSLRLDADLVAHFKEGGPGWQTRMNDALRGTISASELASAADETLKLLNEMTKVDPLASGLEKVAREISASLERSARHLGAVAGSVLVQSERPKREGKLRRSAVTGRFLTTPNAGKSRGAGKTKQSA